VNPTLVLLPGMDGTGRLFDPLLKALGSTFTPQVVSYPDRRGNYADHLAIARSALPSSGPYILLGESFSGPVAISLAAQHLPGLVGVILCASFLSCPWAVLSRLRPLLRFVPPMRMPAALSVPFLMGRFVTPELRRAYSAALDRVSPATLLSRLQSIARVDVTAAAQAIQVPCLYLRATADRLVPLKASAAALGAIRHCRLVEVEGPHFLLQTHPEAAATAIVAFAGDECAR